MSDKHLSKIDENNVDIIALFFQIWKDKWYIIAILIFVFMLAVFKLQNSTFKYDITLQVSPSKQMSSSQAAANLGGLASIIGVSTQSSNSTDHFSMYKTLISSRIIAEILSKDIIFIKKYSKIENLNIPQILFENKDLIITDTSWRSSVKSVLGLPSHPKKITLEDIIYDKILNKISISTNKLTKITTINFQSVSSDLGIELLKKVHQISDSTLKSRSLKRTEDYILFLNNQLSKTNKQDQRLSLISTLAEQQRSRMIASSDLSFAAEFFGKPFHSSSPTSPRIRNVVFVYIAVGFFSGLFFSVFRYFLKTFKS